MWLSLRKTKIPVVSRVLTIITFARECAGICVHGCVFTHVDLIVNFSLGSVGSVYPSPPLSGPPIPFCPLALIVDSRARAFDVFLSPAVALGWAGPHLGAAGPLGKRLGLLNVSQVAWGGAGWGTFFLSGVTVALATSVSWPASGTRCFPTKTWCLSLTTGL